MSLSPADAERPGQPSAMAGDASPASIPPTAQPQPVEAGSIRRPVDHLVWLPTVVVLGAMGLLLVAYGQYGSLALLFVPCLILASVTMTWREEIAAGIYPLLGYPSPYPGKSFRLTHVFKMVGSAVVPLLPFGIIVARNLNRPAAVEVDRAPQRSQQQAPQLSARRATLGYWQTAVANLHVTRFQAPAGQEPAEEYYRRLRQELKQLTAAARSAPTSQVDADLVRLVTRHLELDDLLLQFMEQVAEYMKDQQLPAPTDTFDQRMQLTKKIHQAVELQPEIMEKLPEGPVREFLETGIRLESLQEDQFHEIEVMQAVLQERYRGLSFPLPTLTE